MLCRKLKRFTIGVHIYRIVSYCFISIITYQFNTNKLMQVTDKIYIAGHRGMVGSAIKRKLEKEGFTNITTRASQELDLTNQQAVNHFFTQEKPAYVFLAAAKVGGIVANNTYRADFIYQNLMIEANVINASYMHQVTKLLFL